MVMSQVSSQAMIKIMSTTLAILFGEYPLIGNTSVWKTLSPHVRSQTLRVVKPGVSIRSQTQELVVPQVVFGYISATDTDVLCIADGHQAMPTIFPGTLFVLLKSSASTMTQSRQSQMAPLPTLHYSASVSPRCY